MPIADMDFSTNYCAVCDIAHEKGGLYCSTKCQKRDVKAAARSPSKASMDTMSALMERSKSSLSLYAQSNPSTSSINSGTHRKSDSLEMARDAAKSTRPTLDRRLSSQRPLPPVKKNSYSTSMPKSLDLVTPVLTPLTKQAAQPEKVSPGFLYPVQPAGTRFNHLNNDEVGTSNEPRRMFFFKKVQGNEHQTNRITDEEANDLAHHISRPQN